MAVPVLTLISGTVVAQGIAYGARPILTRLFTPEDFGFLALYAASVSVLASVATGRYEDAAMLPESDDEAWTLVRLALGLSLVVAFATIFLVPFRTGIANVIGNHEVAPFLALVPFGVLAVCWGRTLEVWVTRRSRFGTISGARITQTSVSAPTQLAAGAAGVGPFGLIAGHLAGSAASALVLVSSALRNRVANTRGQTATLARRYHRFPLFSMPSGFLNALSMQLPAFVLLAMYSVEAAGFFGVAFSALGVPMHLVGASVARVFFVRSAEANREGTLRSLTEHVAKRLALFGAFPLAAMMVVGPAAFVVVFGEEWREAGVYAQILAPWMFLTFVGSPLSSLFDVLERQATEFGLNALLFVLRVAALAIGGMQGGAIGALIGFCSVSAVFWLGQSVLLLRWADVSWAASLSLLVRPVLLSLIPIVPLMLLSQSDASDVILLVVAAALTFVYMGLVYRFGRDAS